MSHEIREEIIPLIPCQEEKYAEEWMKDATRYCP